MGLFEEIGGNIQEKEKENERRKAKKIKKHFKSFRFAS